MVTNAPSFRPQRLVWRERSLPLDQARDMAPQMGDYLREDVFPSGNVSPELLARADEHAAFLRQVQQASPEISADEACIRLAALHPDFLTALEEVETRQPDGTRITFFEASPPTEKLMDELLYFGSFLLKWHDIDPTIDPGAIFRGVLRLGGGMRSVMLHMARTARHTQERLRELYDIEGPLAVVITANALVHDAAKFIADFRFSTRPTQDAILTDPRLRVTTYTVPSRTKGQPDYHGQLLFAKPGREDELERRLAAIKDVEAADEELEHIRALIDWQQTGTTFKTSVFNNHRPLLSPATEMSLVHKHDIDGEKLLRHLGLPAMYRVGPAFHHTHSRDVERFIAREKSPILKTIERTMTWVRAKIRGVSLDEIQKTEMSHERQLIRQAVDQIRRIDPSLSGIKLPTFIRTLRDTISHEDIDDAMTGRSEAGDRHQMLTEQQAEAEKVLLMRPRETANQFTDAHILAKITARRERGEYTDVHDASYCLTPRLARELAHDLGGGQAAAEAILQASYAKWDPHQMLFFSDRDDEPGRPAVQKWVSRLGKTIDRILAVQLTAGWQAPTYTLAIHRDGPALTWEITDKDGNCFCEYLAHDTDIARPTNPHRDVMAASHLQPIAA